MSNILASIADWHNRASPSEAQLFCPKAVDLDGLRSGKKCFIIGSKGAGKSAVLRFLERSGEKDALHIENSFSPPLLHSFCEQTSGRPLRGAELELLWTYFICSKVCVELCRKKHVRGPLNFDLSAKYGLSNRRGVLQRIAGVVRKVGVSLKFKMINAVDADLKVGLTGSLPEGEDYPWAVQAEFAREDAVKAVKASGQRVFVFFDEVDVQFNQARKRQTFDAYLETVEALLTATYKLRNRFQAEGAMIFPIIALRSDIYDYIENADKGGWRTHSERLSFDGDEIREIVAHRLSQAIGADLPFSEAWKRAVNDERPYSDPDSAYEQIQRRSLNRPRDYVEFPRLAATEEVATRQGRKRISRAAINRASLPFSEYFVQEFKDEFAFRYDFADRIVDVFKTLCPTGNRNQFTFEAFKYACEARGILGDVGFFIDLAKYLFSVSVFGIQIVEHGVGPGPVKFRYRDADLKFPSDVNGSTLRFALHTGLLKAILNEV